MSRITGKDAANLIEAYNAVYASQEEVELTEEQVQEDFENWVNSLVEEGHDLSEYTWEDMYEAYVSEDLIGDLRSNAGRAVSAVRSGISAANRAAGAVNQAMVNRIRQNVPQTTAAKPAPSRTFGSDSGGSTGFGRYGQATQLITRPSATPTAPATRPPAAPAAPAARPTAQPVGSARPTPAPQKPTSTATATPPGPPSRYNPLMQRTFGYQTGNAPDQIAKASAGAPPAPAGGALGAAARPEVRAALNLPARPAAATPAPAPAATPTAPKPPVKKTLTPTQMRQGISASFDPFDVVMGYLIDEGYAESEEAAAVIMANMSDEWRQSIMEVVTTTGEKAPKAVPSQMFPNAPRMGAERPFQEPFINPSGAPFKGASKSVKKDIKTA